MPACADCNQRYGRIEHELLTLLGLCLDPADHRSMGVTERVQRSLDPTQARNERDREHRQKRRERILRQLIPAAMVPQEAIFPGFGPHPGTAPEDKIAALVPPELLEALTEKIVRGITYVLDERYIEDDHSFEIFFRHEVDASPFRELLKRFGSQHHRGPGIAVTRAVPHDDPISGLFEIEIWGRFKAWATVRPKDSRS